ncbi:MAG: hypothetical protein ACI9FJ_001338 [Alteromonadaceae bacterium]|jgi:hypothetical protein
MAKMAFVFNWGPIWWCYGCYTGNLNKRLKFLLKFSAKQDKLAALILSGIGFTDSERHRAPALFHPYWFFVKGLNRDF